MTVDILEKLAQLLEQDQFELILPDEWKVTDGVWRSSGKEKRDIRLVYLMNDAVESFLVFRNASMTGEYHSAYEGELEASLDKQENKFSLVVRQGGSVVTVFFEEADIEVNLYEYSQIGHFWVQNYEYLRQLEYRFAILRDKYEYLGEQFCTEGEKELLVLTEFPPLNYCCYPAVSRQYIAERKNPWKPSENAIDFMLQTAEECNDTGFEKILLIYRRYPFRFIAQILAWMLHRVKHKEIVNLLTRKLRNATKGYKKRIFGKEKEDWYKENVLKLEERQAKLMIQGIESEILREEPFTIACDSVEYKLYLMIWKEIRGNRVIELEEYRYSQKNFEKN